MLGVMAAPSDSQPANLRPEMIFYDGRCALCHGTVKFVLKRDQSGTAFRFAPLQGKTFSERVPETTRKMLPDSIVVLTDEGALLVRSDAFVHILARLGGGWKFVAGVLRVIPRPMRDVIYNFIARVRYGVFGTRSDVCPLAPPDLRSRFDP
jgi:predicted DCC family thiol-disulfide oxidoreductase YuxK